MVSGRVSEQADGSYTKAIEVSSKEEAVFYSNRAACKSRVMTSLVNVRLHQPVSPQLGGCRQGL